MRLQGEEEELDIRRRGALAVQAVFAGLGFPPITDDEVRGAVSAYDSRDLPDRDRAADVDAANRVIDEQVTGIDVASALDRAGLHEAAEAILGMQRIRASGDYLQTSAIVNSDWSVRSAVNDPNAYTGSGTGYRLDGARWDQLWSKPHATSATAEAVRSGRPIPKGDVVGVAEANGPADEVVIGVGPAFLSVATETISGLPHEEVFAAITSGIEESDASWRLVRITRTSDVAFIAHDAAPLSGSTVGIGIQSKGTTVIHRADLEPLDNPELFGMAPLLTLDSYWAIGRNAAAYVLGKRPSPVPVEIDNFARARLIVPTTLLQALETGEVVPDGPALELRAPIGT